MAFVDLVSIVSRETSCRAAGVCVKTAHEYGSR